MEQNDYLIMSYGGYSVISCKKDYQGEVIIPNGVKAIRREAFIGCSFLTSIKIPDSVTLIEDNAFRGCTNLKEFIVDVMNTNYSSKYGALYSKDLSKLIAVPGGKGMIIISKNVTEICDSAFSCRTGILNIFVDDNNPYFCAIDGALFSKNISKLLFVPNNYNHFNIPDKVTEIGNFAFTNCTSLTSIEVPSSVTEIGFGAFSGCTSLTSIEIPSSVTKISSDAFFNCASLKSFEIPSSVTEIGRSAFKGCTELMNYIVDEENPNFCDIDGVLYSKDTESLISVPGGLKGKYTISNGVKKIDNFAFSGCTSLTSIEIPNSVRVIGVNAFSECTSLTSIEIPNSVREIHLRAFSGCQNLTSIEIPCIDNKIDRNVFYGCINLNEIYLKRNYHVDFFQAFRDLDISKITLFVPFDSFDSYKSDYNYNRFKEILIKTKQYECLTLSDDDKVVISCQKDYKGVVKIPNSVTEISKYAFSGCKGLASILIPESVKKIGKHAFDGCISLSEIEIPESVTVIGEESFFGCTGINNIIVDTHNKNYCDVDGALFSKDLTNLYFIPNKYNYYAVPYSVTKIESRAFSNCTNLTSIDILSRVKEICDGAFRGARTSRQL